MNNNQIFEPELEAFLRDIGVPREYWHPHFLGFSGENRTVLIVGIATDIPPAKFDKRYIGIAGQPNTYYLYVRLSPEQRTQFNAIFSQNNEETIPTTTGACNAVKHGFYPKTNITIQASDIFLLEGNPTRLVYVWEPDQRGAHIFAVYARPGLKVPNTFLARITNRGPGSEYETTRLAVTRRTKRPRPSIRPDNWHEHALERVIRPTQLANMVREKFDEVIGG